MKCHAIDGSGFKSVIGNMPFTPGYRYYYEVKIDKGSLIKIGVCLDSVNVEEVV
jgi:hypothetical protein